MAEEEVQEHAAEQQITWQKKSIRSRPYGREKCSEACHTESGHIARKEVRKHVT